MPPRPWKTLARRTLLSRLPWLEVGDEKVELPDGRVIALSFPAGYLDPGEDPLGAAKRELREEAGYEARDWTALGRYVVDGNYGCGAEHAFLARGAHRTTALPSDDLEEFEVSLLPLPDLITAWRRGEIAQLSSAAALGLALLSIRA